jgi:hypothetical protein
MVSAIDRVIGSPIERRTIEGFDYNSRPAARPPKRAAVNRRPAARRSRANSGKSGASKGTFAPLFALGANSPKPRRRKRSGASDA